MDYTARELKAFIQYASREKILKSSGMTRHRYETLKDDPSFMQQVNEYRTQIVGDVVRKLEGCLETATEELDAIIKDHDTGSQTRLNAIRVMYDSYSRLSEREDILKRLDALESAQISQNQTT